MKRGEPCQRHMELGVWLVVTLMLSVLSNYICLMFSISQPPKLPITTLQRLPTIRCQAALPKPIPYLRAVGKGVTERGDHHFRVRDSAHGRGSLRKDRPAQYL